MTSERYNELSKDLDLSLTQGEIDEGWHFCNEFDGLLVLGDPGDAICGKSCIEWEGRLENDPMPLICGRCYDEVSEKNLFPANCNEKPEKLLNAPIGMYHCPDCGAMVLAGMPHPNMCQLCIDRKHPYLDDTGDPR